MVTFAKPPLSEVSIGQVFVGRQDLLIPYFGTIWDRIRDRYPNVAHAPIIVSEGAQPVIDIHGSMLPRVWFISKDESMLVQLQQDRMYVNWRNVGDEMEYVRFPVVRAEFDSMWNLLNVFMLNTTGNPLLPLQLEVTYTNIIPIGQGWSNVAEFGKVLRTFSWLPGEHNLAVPRKLSSQMEILLDDGASVLTVRVGTAKRVKDQQDVMRFELAVNGSPAPGQERDEWLEYAHAAIVNGFKDLTTAEMHNKYWGLA